MSHFYLSTSPTTRQESALLLAAKLLEFGAEPTVEFHADGKTYSVGDGSRLKGLAVGFGLWGKKLQDTKDTAFLFLRLLLLSRASWIFVLIVYRGLILRFLLPKRGVK